MTDKEFCTVSVVEYEAMKKDARKYKRRITRLAQAVELWRLQNDELQSRNSALQARVKKLENKIKQIGIVHNLTDKE